MSGFADCRLLCHEPASGAWNMAVDEMLLERAQHGAVPCMRFYGWNEPTLSLGYFQLHEDRSQHPSSIHCAAVRRLTGGGAILHDAELTYSLVLPAAHPLAAHRDELYRTVHGCLIEILRQFGISAQVSPGEAPAADAAQPFLCFQRRALGDVVAGGIKVAGSAQRRRGNSLNRQSGAVLQHGSLLWKASPAAPELPGLEDIAARVISMDSLRDLWLAALSRELDLTWRPDSLDANELSEAETLVKSRYGHPHWTKNRGRNKEHSQETF